MNDEYPFEFCGSCYHRDDEFQCDDCESGELYEVDPDVIVIDDVTGLASLNKILLAA